jgi:hypothetical protein
MHKEVVLLSTLELSTPNRSPRKEWLSFTMAQKALVYIKRSPQLASRSPPLNPALSQFSFEHSPTFCVAVGIVSSFRLLYLVVAYAEGRKGWKRTPSALDVGHRSSEVGCGD